MGFAQRDRTGVAAPVAAKRRMGLRVRAVWALGTSRCHGSVFSSLPFLRGEMSRAALPGCIFFSFSGTVYSIADVLRKEGSGNLYLNRKGQERRMHPLPCDSQ